MTAIVEIPKAAEGDYKNSPNSPVWYPTIRDGKPAKPIIRCNCGLFIGMALHHVFPDGQVRASFFHSRGTNSTIGEDPRGCGWHVYLKLKDYDRGEFDVEKVA